ncbi:hypothetical protein OsI_27086 [Oryza sativa Indica Group]|uniref:WAT1-related protein n=1 Tax=Oryza sativa subsp. indica TaxID=39946 RepID=B8B549_ORYSI|nr:hypothetical protein OsI_27086 [Oryza sativa Indica Group]
MDMPNEPRDQGEVRVAPKTTTAREVAMLPLSMLLVQLITVGVLLLSKLALNDGMSPFVIIVYRNLIASAVVAPLAVIFESDEVDSEHSREDDDISDLVRDLAFGLDDRGEFEDASSEPINDDDLEALQKLVEGASQELYPGSKNFSKLRFVQRECDIVD